jgi:hypothetical protein
LDSSDSVEKSEGGGGAMIECGRPPLQIKEKEMKSCKPKVQQDAVYFFHVVGSFLIDYDVDVFAKKDVTTGLQIPLKLLLCSIIK